MDNFKEKFDTKSNTELMKIIKDSKEYRIEAIQAAKDILESRNLNDEDIEYAKEEITNQWRKNEFEKKKKKESEKKIKEAGLSFIDPINPLKSKLSTSERIIRTITILIGLMFIYGLYEQLGMIYYLLTENGSRWESYEIILYLSPLVIIAISLISFHRRKRTGWTIFTVLFTFTTCLSILNLSMALNTGTLGNYFLDSFFPSPLSSLGGVIINGAFLWFLCKEKVREVYSVDKKRMYSTVGFITVLTFLVLVVLK